MATEPALGIEVGALGMKLFCCCWYVLCRDSEDCDVVTETLRGVDDAEGLGMLSLAALRAAGELRESTSSSAPGD